MLYVHSIYSISFHFFHMKHVGALGPLCRDLYKKRNQISIDLDAINSLKEILFPERSAESEDVEIIAERVRLPTHCLRIYL